MKVYEVLERRREENYEYLVRHQSGVGIAEIIDYMVKQENYDVNRDHGRISLYLKWNSENLAILKLEETISPEFTRIKVRDCGIGITAVGEFLSILEKF